MAILKSPKGVGVLQECMHPGLSLDMRRSIHHNNKKLQVFINQKGTTSIYMYISTKGTLQRTVRYGIEIASHGRMSNLPGMPAFAIAVCMEDSRLSPGEMWVNSTRDVL